LANDVARPENLRFSHFERLDQGLVRWSFARAKQDSRSADVIAGRRKRLLQRIGKLKCTEITGFVQR
jgi:hypothetical protein